ncbi:MAG: DNA repair protein RadC [Myxococcales bacterium FL481]|nr:MAG: DNA repair protein RadC [Myxococcales bacterium FL481]
MVAMGFAAEARDSARPPNPRRAATSPSAHRRRAVRHHGGLKASRWSGSKWPTIARAPEPLSAATTGRSGPSRSTVSTGQGRADVHHGGSQGLSGPPFTVVARPTATPRWPQKPGGFFGTRLVIDIGVPLPIADVMPQERPRERMLLYGAQALSDVELIALLVGGGRALMRAAVVLDGVGGLPGLADPCPHELAKIPGMGDASSTALVAAIELSRRLGRLRLPYGKRLRDPAAVTDFVRGHLRGARQEVFVVVGLDARQRVRLVRQVGLGSLAHVDVHPREVFRPLLRAGVHSAILVHNHPSGEAEPSLADVELTERLAAVGQLVGIRVLDHLVVSDFGSTSLAAAGLLPTSP